MTTKISCKTTAKGIQSFYLECNDGKFFLFSQNYRKGVKEYYGPTGIALKVALDVSRSKGDTAVIRTMRKLIPYIKYVEKEYDIVVLDKTASRQRVA